MRSKFIFGNSFCRKSQRTQVQVEDTQVLSWPSIPGKVGTSKMKNKYGEVGKVLEK